MSATAVYVARFGPIVLAIFSVLVTVLIGLAFTIPFFATARGIRRQEGWTKVMGTIAVILSIAVFPLGTAFSLHTLWYLFLSPDQKSLTR